MRLSTLKPDASPSLEANPASSARLRETVEALNYPRHYNANPEANLRARDWLVAHLEDLGMQVSLQGKYDNVIATFPDLPQENMILLSAHYDTVPTTPGADDNNSAIAVCLEAARAISLAETKIPIMIAIFNREEDGLLGSIDFVQDLGTHAKTVIAEAHNFEMVGYFDHRPGSQSKPANLPVPIPDTGNFIAIISNSDSNRLATQVVNAAKTLSRAIPLVSLKTYFGIEKVFGDLLRSDHAPFWEADVPTLMWTDASNFRNPHYHAPTDTPDTLDYEAMADVTRMIICHVSPTPTT